MRVRLRGLGLARRRAHRTRRSSGGAPSFTTWSGTRSGPATRLGWAPSVDFDELIALLVEAELARLAARCSAGDALVDRVVRAGRRVPREARGVRAGPPASSSAARASASRTPAAIASGSSGSKSTAASPQTSGSEPARDAATGQPHAIASSGGRPKPSYRLGKTMQAARR